jgi:hypothetical protein
MQVRERFIVTLALAAALSASVAACSGTSPSGAENAAINDGPPADINDGPPAALEDGRPAALKHLPLVELVGPAATNAGPVPIFEWGLVDGAEAYRLSVRGPDARMWAWSGSETSVRYGGVAEGQSGPTIVPGSRWSVAAFGGDGSLVALSDLRPVSPTDDPGPAPDWLAAPAANPAATPAAAQASPAGEFDACDLFSADEITAAIDGTWGEPVLAYADVIGGRCEWTSANGSILSIDVLPATAYDPEGWGADGTVEGLGEQSYIVSHGWDRRIGFVRGDRSVMLTIDWTRVDLEAFAAIARQIEERLPSD